MNERDKQALDQFKKDNFIIEQYRHVVEKTWKACLQYKEQDEDKYFELLLKTYSIIESYNSTEEYVGDIEQNNNVLNKIRVLLDAKAKS